MMRRRMTRSGGKDSFVREEGRGEAGGGEEEEEEEEEEEYVSVMTSIHTGPLRHVGR
jgi:hypothetical protein